MGNRLSKIYTRTGGDGTTALGDGSRVAKNDPRVEAYGCVNECNSAIGVVLAVPGLPVDVRDLLLNVQDELFDLGVELCIPGHRGIEARHVAALEGPLGPFHLAGKRGGLEGNGLARSGTALGIDEGGGLVVDIDGYGAQLLHAAEVSILDA